MRLRSWFVVSACVLVANCSGAVVTGPFNNQRNPETALTEHAEAWSRDVGEIINRRRLENIMRQVDGECFDDGDLMTCVVNVKARPPLIFTQRHMWTLTFEREGPSRFKAHLATRQSLGWDF